MNTQKLNFTAADRAAQGDGAPDLLFKERQGITLAHQVSPELTPGDARHVPGLVIGGFAVPQGDVKVAFNDGFEFLLVGLTLDHPQYGADTAAGRGRYVTSHGVNMPREARWLDAGPGVSKSGHYLPNGDKIVQTVTGHMLVGGFGCGYDFYGSAFKVGKALAISAQRLRAIGEDETGKRIEVRGCTLGRWRMTSFFEKKGAYTYPVPKATRIGKLGEAGGPTLEEWRVLQSLRQAFREGEEWMPMEAIEPPAPPLFEAALPRPDIRSGRGAWDHDSAPPVDSYDGPEDDPEDDAREY
jgi:hypothetical protein